LAHGFCIFLKCYWFLTEHEYMGPILTQAEGMILGTAGKMFSCCGARHLRRRQCAFLICRPLPLAQVALSATGGAPIAPHRRAL